MQGTSFDELHRPLRLRGRRSSHGFEAVAVTERDEPQAVIGSHLHELAYPDGVHAPTRRAGGQLTEAYHHGGDVLSLQLRGEYLFAAQGKDGLRIYDVAQIDHKGFSERIVTRARLAARPEALREDEGRDVGGPAHHHDRRPQRARCCPENEEQPVHPLYDYLFVTDREEGPGRRRAAAHAARRRPAQQLPRSARRPSTRTACSTGADLDDHRRHHRLRHDARGARRRSTSTTRCSPQVARPRSAQPACSEPRAVAVQFRYAFVRRRGGPEGRRRDRSARRRALVPGALVPLARRAQPLPRPHLRLRRRRARRASPSWTSRRPSSRASIRRSTPAAPSTTPTT